MKIAVNAQQLSHLPIQDVIDFATELKVDGIELWPENLPGGEHEQSWRGRDIQSATAAIHAAGMKVACITHGFHAFPQAKSVEKAAEGVIHTLDTAVIADSGLINLYTAGISSQMFVEIMKIAVPEAAKRRVVISLENEAHDDSAFPEMVVEMLDAIDSPWLRTQYDPCNYFHAGYSAFPEPLDILGFRIGYLHLKGGGVYQTGTNTHRGSKMRDSEEPIGYGPISGADWDMKAVVLAMKTRGYAGWVTMEPHVSKDAIKEVLRVDREWLKKILH
jgi:sugar phosphate isomerase/epimerase